jgi:leader peptidase (prepilin peptidase) / N-methyltransferase
MIRKSAESRRAYEALEQNRKLFVDWIIIATGGIFGLLAGSFLNVVIHRGPAIWKLVDDETRRGNLSTPRSYCPACKIQLHTAHLIPVFSYLLLGGKCRACAAPIPIRYPIVELLGAAAGVVSVVIWGSPGAAIAAAVFFWVLIALAVIDLETGYLPDALVLPLLGAGLAVNTIGLFIPIFSAVIGAAVGYGAFWLISFIFVRLRGIEGLGMGDAKLLAAIGAWLGWQALAPVVLLAALLALAGIGVANLRGHKIGAQTPAPFGPALAAAGAIIMIALANNWLAAAAF